MRIFFTKHSIQRIKERLFTNDLDVVIKWINDARPLTFKEYNKYRKVTKYEDGDILRLYNGVLYIIRRNDSKSFILITVLYWYWIEGKFDSIKR